MKTYARVLVWVELESDYPTKPIQRPIRDVIDHKICDALRNVEGIVQPSPSTIHVEIQLVEAIEPCESFW